MSAREDDEESDSDSDYGRKKQVVKYPRFIKHNLDDVDVKAIVLNTHKSQYGVLDDVALELGWASEKEPKSETWDILWTDTMIQADDLFKMHEFQKISHFPGINILARKNSLGKTLMKLRKEFQKQYEFFPLTWSLPSDYNELVMFAQNEQNKKSIFIVKPEASCQGKGIFLTKSIKELDGCTYVVQEYLENPLLLSKLKFDFRLYVLVLGCDPLRIYIYEEGLTRFATEPYKHPKQKNLKSACVHLTNYSLNKKNPNFIFNTSEEKMDVGHKRSFSSILIHLQKMGVDIKTLKSKINDLVIKTMISAQPFLTHIYRLCQPNNLSNDMCFQILGFDIILDEFYTPFLLQVNHNPSLVTDTPLDKFIKKKLVKDTFALLNINTLNKQAKVMKKKKQISDKQNGVKTKKLELLEKQLLKKQHQYIRDEFQNANLGGFTKIYPSEDQDLTAKYNSFLEKSEHLFQEISGIKYDFRSESITLSKYQKKVQKELKLIQNVKKKSYSVKTTPRKSINEEKSDSSKITPVSNHIILSAKQNPKFKFPSIQKGKFLVPQTFNIKDWGTQSPHRVPVYLKDFLSNREEKRNPSSRHKSLRKRV